MPATIVVITAMVGYGFNPFFARWIYEYGLSPEIIVVYRYGIPAFLMLPFIFSIQTHSKGVINCLCRWLGYGIRFSWIF